MTRTSIGSLALGLCLSLTTACGSDGDGCETYLADNSAVVTPTALFTGFNGRDPYQAIIKTNFGAVEWISSDASVVTAETYGCLPLGTFGITGVLTTTGAGAATVTAQSGDFTRDVSVTVTGYTPEQFDLGRTRYRTAVDGTPGGRACGDCHEGGGGAPHSPGVLAANPDAELIAATTTGAYPDVCLSDGGGRCSCTPDPVEGCANCPGGPCTLSQGYDLSLDAVGEPDGQHIFTVTAEEQMGVMAYMRGLPIDELNQ